MIIKKDLSFANGILFLLGFVLINLYVMPVYAEKRVALVIGNSAYFQNELLSTPVNDAEKMALVLKNIGFDVTLGTNLTYEQMGTEILRFRKKLQPGVDNLFYYSGHAVQYNGENYLIPVDAIPLISNAEQLKHKTVNVNYLLSTFQEAKNALNIVILEACRDNPFNFSDMKRGLAKQSSNKALIAYATEANKVVPKNQGSNSRYTKHLLKFLSEKPTLRFESLLKKVRIAVRLETNGLQLPYYTGGVEEEFFPSNPNDTLNPMLFVDSNVDGGTIFIDGEEIIETPMEIGVRLPEGKHTVEVKKFGYFSSSKEINLKKDGQVVQVNLKPNPLELSGFSWQFVESFRNYKWIAGNNQFNNIVNLNNSVGNSMLFGMGAALRFHKPSFWISANTRMTLVDYEEKDSISIKNTGDSDVEVESSSIEYSFSVGSRLTDRFSAYLGYQYNKQNFDIASLSKPSELLVVGDLEYRTKGPFLGGCRT